MKAAVFSFAVAFAAPAVWAQGFLSNDYEIVFEENRDAIVEITTDSGQIVEQLELPGQIRLQRRTVDGQTAFRSVDASGAGAVGCMMGILMEFNRAARQCQGETTESQRAHLDSALSRVAAFFHANRVPAVDIEALNVAIEAHADRPIEGGACAKLSPESEFRALFDGMMVTGLDSALDELLAVPRLPVVNPCL